MDVRADVAFAAGEPPGSHHGKTRRPARRRGACRDQGDWHLPYRRVHLVRHRPGRPLTRHPRTRRGWRRRRWSGCHVGQKGDHVIPVYMPDAGRFRHVRRARPIFAPRSARSRVKASCLTAPRVFSIEGEKISSLHDYSHHAAPGSQPRVRRDASGQKHPQRGHVFNHDLVRGRAPSGRFAVPAGDTGVMTGWLSHDFFKHGRECIRGLVAHCFGDLLNGSTYLQVSNCQDQLQSLAPLHER
jgi:hypothetical protein